MITDVSELHILARAVAAPPLATATYFDQSLAGPEWKVACEEDAQELLRALVQRAPTNTAGTAALATGKTGLDVYRNAAIAARVLAGRAPVRVRWGRDMGIKAAALALLFGATELCGPLAKDERRKEIDIIGGDPEDPACPTRAYVEAQVRAAGRTPRWRAPEPRSHS
ncbi:MAG: hypothetical protein HY698_06265 [Deltaproteobacteria bacterium]|nr:hypothetical protein [Deltaproteobacteria bacterium]